MVIEKSQGQTPTEQLLARLCERTFLKLWSYPNPFKADGKELCDLIAFFGNHVFLLFDRESRKFDDPGKDPILAWERWKKEVIDKQIKTADGAARYVRSQQPIYLDPKQEVLLPLRVPEGATVHKIIVAHGAEDACKNFSPDNIYGSLAISYGNRTGEGSSFPFMVNLRRDDPVHILDSLNLQILLGELDTFHDFMEYIVEKERAISTLRALVYAGEEDLLAHYLLNFDTSEKKHRIGTKDAAINLVMIGEGEWRNFIESKPYRLKKEADASSYLWDDIIQRTCDNALKGVLLGEADLFANRNAIYEMAREPRFSRRALSDAMTNAVQNFPEDIEGLARNLSFMPSFFKETGYVFLQIKHPNITNYETEYRPRRQAALQIACGAAKNRFPHLSKVIGIAIEAPKFTDMTSEDFLLLECANWSDEDATQFRDLNKDWGFFETGSTRIQTVRNFPRANDANKRIKIGRNKPCPCGSGRKHKFCCLR